MLENDDNGVHNVSDIEPILYRYALAVDDINYPIFIGILSVLVWFIVDEETSSSAQRLKGTIGFQGL